MSEEIKKILRILKAKSTRYEYCLKENISYNDESYEAHLLLDHITNLQQKAEQLENIIDVKKCDYDYLETLFSKSSKEEVLKAYTYKCEQLEKVGGARNEFQMKSMQLENIRKEAIEYIEENCTDYLDENGKIKYSLVVSKPLLNILNKGSE